MRRRGSGPAAVLLLAALIAVFLYFPSLFEGKVLASEDLIYGSAPFASEAPPGLDRPSNPLLGDAVFVYNPHRVFAREQIRAGELPLWSPLIGAGRPLGAEQGAPFFPLNGLSYALPFWDSLVWIATLKLILTALGTFLFCRRLGLRPAAAVLGGIAFAFSTFYLVLLDGGQSMAFGVLPWSLWLVDRVTARGRPADALALGLVSGLALLNGHPESAAIALLVVLAYAIFRFRHPHSGDAIEGPDRSPEIHDGPSTRRRFVLFLAAATLAAGVGAVAIVSTVEILGQAESTERGGGERSWRLLSGLVFPNYWGRADTTAFPGAPSHFAERAFYIGALPLLLVLVSLRRRPPPAHIFMSVLAVLTLLLCVSTPLKSIAESLPGAATVELGHLQGIAVFALAILAAFGFHRLLGADSRERLRLLRRAALAGAVPLLAILVDPGMLAALGSVLSADSLVENAAPTADAARLTSILRWGVLVAAGLGLVFVVLRRTGSALAVGAVVLAITVVDVALMDSGYRPSVEPSVASPPTPPSLELATERAEDGRVAGNEMALFPNLAERYGVRDPRAEDLPALRRYVALYEALGGKFDPAFGSSLLDLREPGTRALLEMFAVRYVVSDPGPVPEPYKVVVRTPDDQVLKVPGRPPRAWVVSDWSPASGFDDAGGAIERLGVGNLTRRPVIEGAPSPPAHSAETRGSAKMLVDEPTRVDVATRSKEAGYLVLSDTIYPGWSAMVDGVESPVRAANLSFRAVAVPAGRHLVSFRYEPRAVQVAALVSGASAGLAVFALVGIGAGTAMRRRRAADDPR